MLREYPGPANMFQDRAADAEREIVFLQSGGTFGQIHHEVDVLPGLHVDADVLAARIEVAKSGGVPVVLAADLENRAWNGRHESFQVRQLVHVPHGMLPSVPPRRTSRVSGVPCASRFRCRLALGPAASCRVPPTANTTDSNAASLSEICIVR